MKNKTLRQKTDMVIAACFALLLAALALANAGLVTEPIKKLAAGQSTAAKARDDIAAAYLSDGLWEKNSFVTANGLFARASGLRVHNGVTLTRNGMLTVGPPIRTYPLEVLSQRVKSFSDYLAGMGIPFLYAMPALKIDIGDQLLPMGVEIHNNENASALVSGLLKRGVNTLDLRHTVAESPDHVRTYYYRTDHHWNTDGAFAAFGAMMERLAELDPEITPGHTVIHDWDRHTKDNWFLGSYGQRVGPLYAGTDALIWYTPRFPAEMSCVVPSHRRIYQGSFEEAVIREKYIDQRTLYGDSAYCVYIGGDYPVTLHRCAQAPNDKKLLLIKDSFGVPLQAFFASEFTQVDVIDPRYYTYSSLAEYVAWTQPDAVVMCMLHSTANNLKESVFGTSAFPQGGAGLRWTAVTENAAIELPAKDSTFNTAQMPGALENGRCYRLRVEGLEPLAGDPRGVSALLYDIDAKSVVREVIFDVAYCREHPDVWGFRVPDNGHRHCVYVYAGLYGQTTNIGVRYGSLTLERME